MVCYHCPGVILGGKSLRNRFSSVNSNKVVSRTCPCHSAAVVSMLQENDLYSSRIELGLLIYLQHLLLCGL